MTILYSITYSTYIDLANVIITYTTQLLLLKQKQKIEIYYIIVAESSLICAQPAPNPILLDGGKLNPPSIREEQWTGRH